MSCCLGTIFTIKRYLHPFSFHLPFPRIFDVISEGEKQEFTLALKGAPLSVKPCVTWSWYTLWCLLGRLIVFLLRTAVYVLPVTWCYWYRKKGNIRDGGGCWRDFWKGYLVSLVLWRKYFNRISERRKGERRKTITIPFRVMKLFSTWAFQYSLKSTFLSLPQPSETLLGQDNKK